MATSTKSAFRLISRQANVTPGPLPDEFIDRLWPEFDRGARRAILQLYRSSPEDVLARAGERLGRHHVPRARAVVGGRPLHRQGIRPALRTRRWATRSWRWSSARGTGPGSTGRT